MKTNSTLIHIAGSDYRRTEYSLSQEVQYVKYELPTEPRTPGRSVSGRIAACVASLATVLTSIPIAMRKLSVHQIWMSF